MGDTQSDQSSDQDSRILSTEDLQLRANKFYTPTDTDEGRWFRCQRENNGKKCNVKVSFPTGLRAHENHHSIKTGDGPLISQEHSSSSGFDESEVEDLDDDEVEEEMLEKIYSEFNNLGPN